MRQRCTRFTNMDDGQLKIAPGNAAMRTAPAHSSVTTLSLGAMSASGTLRTSMGMCSCMRRGSGSGAGASPTAPASDTKLTYSAVLAAVGRRASGVAPHQAPFHDQTGSRTQNCTATCPLSVATQCVSLSMRSALSLFDGVHVVSH